MEGNYLNVIKAIHEKPTVNIVLNGERLKAFPLRSDTGKGARFCHCYWTSAGSSKQSN